MKVFVIESPNPNDLLDERNEAESLISVCKMFEHQVADFFVKSKCELITILNYLKGIELEEDDYIIFHFSCHGNENGLSFGNDFLKWVDFLKVVKTLFKDNDLAHKYSFIISACGSNKQKLSKYISKLVSESIGEYYPPEYLIIYNSDEVFWADAILSWTILYHHLSNKKKIVRGEMQKIMKKMESVGFGELIYFRWDADEKKYKYKQYPPRNG